MSKESSDFFTVQWFTVILFLMYYSGCVLGVGNPPARMGGWGSNLFSVGVWVARVTHFFVGRVGRVPSGYLGDPTPLPILASRWISLRRGSNQNYG